MRIETYSLKPSWQDVEDYIDGTVNPLLMRNDDDYVYRGVNEDAAFSADNEYPCSPGDEPALSPALTHPPILLSMCQS